MNKSIKALVILALLITVGIALQLSGMLDPHEMIAMARGYTEHWWLAVLLVLLQVVLFTFALAGSTFLWVAATLYPPMTAALILAAGAMFGGISAYFFSRKLTDEWIHKVENSRVYKLMQKEDNFFTLFALRIMPAFPHALINYSAGILQIKLIPFMITAFLGIGIKSYVYAKVIYKATTTGSFTELLDFATFGPLLLVSVVILMVIVIKFYWGKKREM